MKEGVSFMALKRSEGEGCGMNPESALTRHVSMRRVRCNNIGDSEGGEWLRKRKIVGRRCCEFEWEVCG